MGQVIGRLTAALADRYTIDRELGSGGMATVYLAHDLKHDREVALKLLRPELNAVLGSERFLREIHIAARLNHPHILPLLDSGEADGLLYYVMPYVAGETLRGCLERQTQLTVEEALELTRQVAAALDYAHRQGVVHRDIKPENILLQEGQAVVADFGIARALRVAGGERLTETGLSLGTPAYMSPEQASGTKELDTRSDVYSLGCVLYEMLAGEPPFTGPNAPAIIARQLVDPVPSLRTVRSTVPENLERVIAKALAKTPADRYGTAGAFVAAADAGARVENAPTGARTLPRPWKLWPRAWRVGTAATVLLGAIALVLVRLIPARPLDITTGNHRHVTAAPGLEFQPALSPDGKEVAYVVGPITRPRIAVRSAVDVGGGETPLGLELAGGHWLPTWAPNGVSVRFWACLAPHESELGSDCEWKEGDSRGGTIQTIDVGNLPDVHHFAWSRDGSRMAFAIGDSIFIRAADMAEPKLLHVHTEDRWPVHSLAWSPDARRIAYVKGNYVWRNSLNQMSVAVWVVGVDGGGSMQVTDDTSMNLSPQWLPDSRHLLFVSNRDGTRGIYAVEVGPDGPRGPPRSVLPSSDAHSLSVSADGTRLAYARFPASQNIWSVPIPRAGIVSIQDAVPVTEGNQLIESHSLSPARDSIVFENALRGNFDLYKQSIDGGQATRVADLPADAFAPQWSPDGSEIAFYSEGRIHVIPAGGGRGVMIATPSAMSSDPMWAPDGRSIAFLSWGAAHTSTVWVVSRDRVGGEWGAPDQVTDFFCARPLLWDPAGRGPICRVSDSTGTIDTDTLVHVSRDGDVLGHFAGMPLGTSASLSPDGSRLYVAGTLGSTRGIWWIPTTGGNLTQVVAFDDPAVVVPWDAFSVGTAHFYLTLARYESDIWVVDLEW